METALLIAYALVLFGQVVLLISAIRRPSARRWIILFAAEAISLAAALVLAAHFNALPGNGMMPGLTYFAEVIYSLAAALAYGVMLLISALCALIVHIRRSYSH